MDEPIWISEPLALAIHARQLAEHGGIDGVRDEGLLQSALASPRNVFAYTKDACDVATLSAAYASAITRNHPFLDGNKRTAAVVFETFLELNGWMLSASDAELYPVMLQLAEGSLSQEELAEWLRERLEREATS
jgi:death-on-curing protein